MLHPAKPCCTLIKCYHLELILSCGTNVIMWDEMLSSGMKCYHLEFGMMLPSRVNVIISSYCYRLELMLSSRANVIMWNEMLSCGLEANAVVGIQFLKKSFMLSSSVIMGMITPHCLPHYILNTTQMFCLTTKSTYICVEGIWPTLWGWKV